MERLINEVYNNYFSTYLPFKGTIKKKTPFHQERCFHNRKSKK